MADTVKKNREPLMHIVKRDDITGWKAWAIRIGAILLGLLLTGVISGLLTGASFGEVYSIMFKGVFGKFSMIFQGKTTMLWRFLQQTAILLCLALAVTPAFKMRFWNCGAEGQALMGGLAAMICMIEIGDKVPNGVLILIILASSLLAGAIWGLIPAIFHALYKTNETLFTLMMNYVATQLVAYYVVLTTAGAGSNIIKPVEHGNLPILLGEKYLLNVLVVTFLMVAVFIYLKYSKHGYEIAVVGESQNTARYVGINVKKVIIRTMMISGAICGIAGMLMVAGTDHSINTNTMGGQGFTAIMISWMGQFNPFIMAAMSGLVTFLKTGAAKVADTFFLNSSYADIVSGIVILFLVGCEFFIKFSVKFRHGKKGGKV
ncbi:MAG: ABC transporter permease [Oscillospiraceae bacterium]|nr:ABC transporter permease [Oscillospiraceae bacterium]